MTTEDRLYAALTSVLPDTTYHLAMDGEPDTAAVYRYVATDATYESDVPIATRDRFEINLYQREHDSALVQSVLDALRDAGFTASMGAQTLAAVAGDAGYSTDTINAAYYCAADDNREDD